MLDTFTVQELQQRGEPLKTSTVGEGQHPNNSAVDPRKGNN